MTDPLNPYAVTTSGVELSHPIHFGGTLTRDDLMMSLLDSPPKRGVARLQYPLLAILTIAGLIAIHWVDRTANEPIVSLTWTAIAFVVLPAWFALVRFLSPGHRRRVSRLELMSANQDYSSGWMDDEHLVVCDSSSVLRARWTFFAPPILFQSHVILPLATDSSHRIVLPTRFFSSAADVNHVCRFLRGKLGQSVNGPPSDQSLDSVEFRPHSDRDIDVEQSRGWTGEHWPYGSDSDQQFEWTIDLTANVSSRLFALKSSLAIVLIMLWYFLPIWVAVAAWLANDFLFFGHWDFLHERILSSAMVLGPAGLIFVIFLYSAIRAAIGLRHTQSQPMRLCLRKAGIHLSHATCESWFVWSAIEDAITEEKHVGWVVRESMEEIRFPAICFESDESFREFQTTLQTLFEGKDESTTQPV